MPLNVPPAAQLKDGSPEEGGWETHHGEPIKITQLRFGEPALTTGRQNPSLMIPGLSVE